MSNKHIVEVIQFNSIKNNLKWMINLSKVKVIFVGKFKKYFFYLSIVDDNISIVFNQMRNLWFHMDPNNQSN